MRRRLAAVIAVWLGIAIAAIALVLAASALHTILRDCDYTTLGIGRPACEEAVQASYSILVASVLVAALAMIAILIGMWKVQRSEIDVQLLMAIAAAASVASLTELVLGEVSAAVIFGGVAFFVVVMLTAGYPPLRVFIWASAVSILVLVGYISSEPVAYAVAWIGVGLYVAMLLLPPLRRWWFGVPDYRWFGLP
jgi:hypothetical protein